VSARVAVRVQPGARREALTGRLASGEWKLAVTAPPEDGRANEAVVELLCGLLGVKRRQLELKRGATSRSKVFEVTGLDDVQVAARLSEQLEGDSTDGE